MTAHHKNTDSQVTPAGIRPGVWLVALGSVFVAILVICLPRTDTTNAPKEAATAVNKMVNHDTASAYRWRAQRNERPSALAPAEPMHQDRRLSEWVADLESSDRSVVQAAWKVLEELGPEATPTIPQLAEMLHAGRACNSVAWTLVHIGTNSFPVLFDALTNGNSIARLEVAGAIGWFREVAEGAVPGLVECMKYDDPHVRANAIASLQAIPKRPEIAVPALVTCLTDPDVNVRGNAATVLPKYGKDSEPAIDALVRAAREDKDDHVKSRAAQAVRSIAPQRATDEGL